MKITIDNLGVVRHIEFDTQKPLSLFCGPNSTGKTYVSYVLYSIFANNLNDYESAQLNLNTAIENHTLLPNDNLVFQNYLAVAYNNLAMLQQNNLKDYESAKINYIKAIKIIEQLPESSKSLNDLATAYNNLASLQENQFADYESAKTNYYKAIEISKKLPKTHKDLNNLAILYNNLANLQQHLNNFKSAEALYMQAIEIRSQLPEDTSVEQNDMESAKDTEVPNALSKGVLAKKSFSQKDIGDAFGISDELVEARFNNTKIELSPLDDIDFLPKATMLTVERNSIYTFKTELSLSRNDLVDKMVAYKDKNHSDLLKVLLSSSRRYPVAVRDGIKIANDLELSKKFKGELFEFATNLEQSLLRGRVDVSQNGDVEFVIGDNVKLPIQLSSSIVKTLSSLILYLKYSAKKGDFLIIDEPEMNLHPDNQILLARIFAQMVNMGIKLVISTHSDYIIREFNNLIMLSGVSDNDMQSFSKMGYDKSMMLKNNDVAAYMFNFDKENLVTVENLDVTETGFDVPTIDAAINSINEASEELYYSLKSRQNEKEH